jgi:trk system potassium uptake protein TrkH
MVIGASPSGTGGGLKTTTLTALWAEMMAVLRRRPTTTFFGRLIPETRLRAAVASLLFYLFTLLIGIYLLALVEPMPLADLIFEGASALGTVGLSRGITGSLTPAGKMIVVALMFLGRLGPVLVGMAFFTKTPAELLATDTKETSEDVAL